MARTWVDDIRTWRAPDLTDDGVSLLAETADVTNTDVLVAALLHDTLEDTETTPAEIEAEFGARVCSIVLEVTDDKSLDKQVRKDEQVRKAPYKSPEAKLVKLADKTCNLRDLLAGPQSDWPQSRLLEYTEWAARVVEGIRGENPDLEGAFDAAFDAALERFGDRS